MGLPTVYVLSLLSNSCVFVGLIVCNQVPYIPHIPRSLQSLHTHSSSNLNGEIFLRPALKRGAVAHFVEGSKAFASL
jgi:hypothetical protein